jgi:hypothetical protein
MYASREFHAALLQLVTFASYPVEFLTLCPQTLFRRGLCLQRPSTGKTTWRHEQRESRDRREL